MPTDRFSKEVDLLDGIRKFSREQRQIPSNYVVSLNSSLGRYVNDTGTIDYNTTRQFVSMMIKNGHLPAGILISVMFQLASMSTNTSSLNHTIKVNNSDIQKVIITISLSQPIDEETTRLKERLERIINLDDRDPGNTFNLTVEHTSEAISQLQISYAPTTNVDTPFMTMMANQNDNRKPNL